MPTINRFSFVFPCKDMSSTAVITCLSTLFNLLGLPLYVHSDFDSSLISIELKQYLNDANTEISFYSCNLCQDLEIKLRNHLKEFWPIQKTKTLNGSTCSLNCVV